MTATPIDPGQLHLSIPEDGPKLIPTETGYTYRCNNCGWRTKIYPTKRAARGAFSNHRCPT